MSGLKLLHTSDWHLGRALYGRRREVEFAAFLDWLADLIEREGIDILLLAGDVFHTHTPSIPAQELYYDFLCRITRNGCRHVVVTGGNHDSPAFLDAPRGVLRALSVRVIGAPTDPATDEVLELRDPAGKVEAIICAVPFLRDRDMRTASAGESAADKERALLAGIRAHYSEVIDAARARRAALPGKVPLIVMGHLFTAGGQVSEGDGVRELYIGSLAHVGADLFPDDIDYLALGHLHVPQRVAGHEHWRYSGAPLQMGFNETRQRKSVCLLEWNSDDGLRVDTREVPVFQRLERVRGDWPALEERLRVLATEQTPIWLEIQYSGAGILPDLRQRLEEQVRDTRLEILRMRDERIVEQVLSGGDSGEELPELTTEEVFARCLAAHEVEEAQRATLWQSYREILATLEAADTAAGEAPCAS